MKRVCITSEGNPNSTKITVDGEPLEDVRAVTFTQDVNSPPSFTFDIYGKPDIECADAEVEYRFIRRPWLSRLSHRVWETSSLGDKWRKYRR